ncbi:hypothetical protein FXF53_18405 [Micromonospora sp. WP24]|uniref:hypothetical protein n=1 Tax=Micromonospora sp. WP24 TaxID=2604469 RepID=UPI0011DAACB1|nr:hypothetical protein [Micromonospora sp. WP24]TYB98098.1 hypothetical protein FXF53_18405 [Micromonospora sp. WP24]
MNPETAAALKSVAGDAPQVVAMLARALDQGLISPEAARDLAGVARNINEDVAQWIHEGGRGINEDTAHWIHEGGRGINEDTAGWLLEAGRNINETVARKFSDTADDINAAAERLERVVRQLDTTSGVLRSTMANAQEWDRAAAAMSQSAEALAFASQAHELDEEESVWSFKNGLIAGFGVALVLAVIVMVIVIKW